MEEQVKTAVHKTSPEDRIKFSQLAAYGAGGIIPIALFNIAGILVGLMGNISLGLSAFWLGVILIIPRLWDAVSDPIIGHISDNTRTRFGRRRPFLLIGGILVAVFFVVMWWIPKGETVHGWFPTEAGFQAFQLVYILIALLLFYTSTTIFEIPHGALGMEMTSDYHERTRLFSAKSFVGNLFAMSTPWLFALANMEIFRGVGGNEADGMRYVSLMIAALIIPLSFWWTYKLREPGFVRVVKQEKSPFWKDMKHAAGNRNFLMLTFTIFTLAMGFNFVQLLGSYIPIFYVFGGDKVAGAYLLGINGTIWAVTGVLAVFPLNWISPKLGKRNTLVIAILLMVLAQLSKIVCYNPDYPYLIIIPTMLLSAGMLFFFTLGSSMVGDICDEDDLKTGKRTEGSFYSIFWWFIKMGTALASFVAGLLIVLTMFDETQVTKVDALQGSIRELRKEVQANTGKGSQEVSLSDFLQKAQTKSSELMKHLEEKAASDKHNKEHFDALLQNMSGVNQRIAGLDLSSSKESLDNEISGIENDITQLTIQSPFTLLMMRIVEIGLPVLLSLLSIFFVLRYSLTEKRSHEIKELLKKRNEEISMGTND
ncbi:MAG TPA: MFS transporter [Bacteroidales bacterium]|nr:MFS transporter [Bacteroidales bacterium]HOX78848.1 MFS transporter [Bacteroidales bacterium]HPI85245.1 MFS transporter [Bacteroidales bacterium]HPM91594.1 MFS transporter [Bacteroidales bacterium]